MNYFIKKIVDGIAAYTDAKYEKDDIEVYYYGAICLSNSVLVNIFVLIYSILFHCFWETICFLTLFSILRNHAGGYHARTSEHCVLFSSMVCVFTKIVILYNYYIIKYKLIIIITSIAISLIVCPLDSKKHHLTKQQRFQEKIVTVSLIIFILGLSYYIPVNYASSILYSIIATELLLIARIVQIVSKKHPRLE